MPRVKGRPDQFKIEVRLPMELFRRVDQKRKAEGYATLSELVRRLLIDYVEGRI